MSNRLEKALLDKNGGNQSEMARFIGVKPQAVQKWIAGKSEPRGRNLKKAAEFLGVPEPVLKYGEQGTAKFEEMSSGYSGQHVLDMGVLRNAIKAALEMDKKGGFNLTPEKMALLIEFWYEEWIEKGKFHIPTLDEARRILRLAA